MSSSNACGGVMGAFGTVSRLALGLFMTGSVALGHIKGPFSVVPWVVGLVVVPGFVYVLHAMLTSEGDRPISATGTVAKVTHIALFFGALGVDEFIPALWFMDDATLLFYGGSMLLAVARGQLDCEVLAFSNMLLRRDDRVGCLIFEPFDRLDGMLRGSDSGADCGDA